MRGHTTIVWLIGELLAIGTSGFVAGYLWPRPGPELELSVLPEPPPIVETIEPAEQITSGDDDTTTEPAGETDTQGQFVASKSGSKYHPVTGCSYADRIKDENRIYFDTAKEAEKAGYEPSSCISR